MSISPSCRHKTEIGFGMARLLGFRLMPRIKRINVCKLYLPGPGAREDYPRIAPALAGPIRWDLIAAQYDQMVKYATAIRTGTASTEAILRRFTRNASHPTYAAMLEVGRADKTAFLARYLRIREVQREVNDGLDMMESWNGANDIIHFGKRGDISSNRRDGQELEIVCLHILQAALVYINTLMIQDVLSELEWADALTDADHRGLTPLFWTHVLPYGEVHLDLGKRLSLGGGALPAAPTAPSRAQGSGGRVAPGGSGAAVLLDRDRFEAWMASGRCTGGGPGRR